MFYQKLLAILFLLTFWLNVYSQEKAKKYALDFADVYVLRVRFIDSLLQRKSPCVYRNGTICVLYKIEVKNVLYCPLNTVYDSFGLTQVKYMIIPKNYMDSLSNKSDYIITAMPSTNSQYIAFKKFLFNEIGEDTFFYHKYAYLSGLIRCKKVKKDVFLNFIKSQKQNL